MIEVVKFDQEQRCVADFLALPQRLYGKKQLTQNLEEEGRLLAGTHILNKYFTLHKFLLYRAGSVAARCAVTIYPQDSVAYIGFFECIDDQACGSALFQSAHACAAEQGCSSVVGPVNASFWIGYRMKADCFGGRPYLSEPYNKDYYQALFQQNGYIVTQRYLSNLYEKLPLLHEVEAKYQKRHRQFSERGYRIVTPKRSDFDRIIGEIYLLLMELYRDFPVFKPIDRADFLQLFQGYRQILDFSMLKMVYHQGAAVAFMVAVPNYHNRLCAGMNPLRYLRDVAPRKIRCGSYVLLYLGVQRGHEGLGRAMVQALMESVRGRRAAVVGALIKEGKPTAQYGKEHLENIRRYVLMEHTL